MTALTQLSASQHKDEDPVQETVKHLSTGSADREALLIREDVLRSSTRHSALYLVSSNLYSAFLVFGLYLISLESILSVALSIVLTIYIYYATDDNTSFDGSTMNWVMLSFAVITPITVSIRSAFVRREQALVHISNIRTTMSEIYLAHTAWDWRKPGVSPSGKAKSNVDWLEHSDKVIREMFGICDELTRWLTLPTSNRARHKTTPWGQREAQGISEVGTSLYDSAVLRFSALADLCEILKEEGLPPNEATRVRQWERFVMGSIENLRMLKCYRTPQALRSFARLFSVFMPPLYVPYYAQLAHDLNSLGMAIAFAVLTSIALTSLFETVAQMEE